MFILPYFLSKLNLPYLLLLVILKGMSRERKTVFEIEGQGKVRVKGYKQGFLKIVFRKSFLSNGHAKVYPTVQV